MMLFMTKRVCLVLWLAVLVSLFDATFAEHLISGESVEAYVERTIKDNEVMVFAKSYCPFCKATRSLLMDMQTSIDFNLNVIELDKMNKEDGAIIQMELLKLTGQRTVPNVFIQGDHIGGNSDLQELAMKGSLQRRLVEISESRTSSTPSIRGGVAF